jgi:hypothetical protein
MQLSKWTDAWSAAGPLGGARSIRREVRVCLGLCSPDLEPTDKYEVTMTGCQNGGDIETMMSRTEDLLRSEYRKTDVFCKSATGLPLCEDTGTLLLHDHS